DDRGGAVGDLRRGTGRDGAVLGERGTELAHRLGGRVGTHALVGVHDRVTLAALDRDRHDLVGEPALLRGRGGALVGDRRELVLVLAGDLQLDVAGLGERTHRLVGRDVVQAVVRHVIEHLDRSVLVPGTALGE